MKSSLFIPQKLKVGFQERNGTYTKKLAYVIYYDQKDVLRKETSWEYWRDKKIDPVEIDNEPTEGFVLNKGVGGGRGWDGRNEYIRVYDPRNFEFEISVANLLFILQECNSNKGKGLEGKFVYAWDRTELVLLPVSSVDYQQSVQFTNLQGQGVSARDLKAGRFYITKKRQEVIYLGRFDWHEVVKDGKKSKPVQKKHVFYNPSNKLDPFVVFSNMREVASIQNDEEVPNYAELVQEYYDSRYGTKPIRLFLQPKSSKNMYWFYMENGFYFECITSKWSHMPRHYRQNRIALIEDALHIFNCYKDFKCPGYRPSHYLYDALPYREPTNDQLFVELESGKIFPILGGNIALDIEE